MPAAAAQSLPPSDASFCVVDTTQPCARVFIMEDDADAGARDPAVRAFAAQVFSAARGASGLLPAPATIAATALAAVQGRGYWLKPGPECFKPAAQTLAEGGDCKHLSVLLVAVCRVLGVPARIVWITQTGQDLNHVAAQVYAQGGWRWADASIAGAVLGEDSYDAAARTAQQHVLGGAPAVASGQAARAAGAAPVRGRAVVTDVADAAHAPGAGTRARVGAVAPAGQLFAPAGPTLAQPSRPPAVAVGQPGAPIYAGAPYVATPTQTPLLPPSPMPTYPLGSLPPASAEPDAGTTVLLALAIAAAAAAVAVYLRNRAAG